MKKLLTLALIAAMCPAIYAADAAAPEAAPEPVAAPAPQSETTLDKIVANMPKISGYLQTGWNWTHNKNTSSSSFQAKRLRLIMDGKVGEKVDFRLQIEAFNGIAGSTNGNGQKNLQVMDAFATWKIIPEFKIRAGQFYTPLGYENYDISPATLETVDFSNIVYRMACRNPYEYNLVDYGRDLGLMFMGDIGDSGKGFRYFHYDVALTNGSLPCKDDRNKTKDLYLSATIRPFKNFNVKATFNWGEYNPTALNGGRGVGFDVDGNPVSKYMPMTRFVAGAWYNDPNGLDLRGEIGLMKSKKNDVKYVDELGAYVFAGYHAGKFLPMVRWDMYKDDLNKTTANNYDRILLGCTYQLFKNVKLQVNWGHFMYKSEAKDALGYSTNDQIQIMGLFKF
ncbi:MAG: porin [Muribaculaceae bacterium]|nr:porin [Muribaculaceae bacterium]MBR3101368.1 porin [Muribaculaceae bacterium]